MFLYSIYYFKWHCLYVENIAVFPLCPFGCPWANFSHPQVLVFKKIKIKITHRRTFEETASRNRERPLIVTFLS